MFIMFFLLFFVSVYYVYQLMVNIKLNIYIPPGFSGYIWLDTKIL